MQQVQMGSRLSCVLLCRRGHMQQRCSWSWVQGLMLLTHGSLARQSALALTQQLSHALLQSAQVLPCPVALPQALVPARGAMAQHRTVKRTYTHAWAAAICCHSSLLLSMPTWQCSCCYSAMEPTSTCVTHMDAILSMHLHPAPGRWHGSW